MSEGDGQFVYAGMVVDECAVPEGPSAIADYMAVLVALYLIQVGAVPWSM